MELTVAAILQKHYGNIHTFTIGFNEAKYNEATYAKQHLGTNHTEKFLDSIQAKEIFTMNHLVIVVEFPPH